MKNEPTPPAPASKGNSARTDYARFFKPGQKIILRTTSAPDNRPKRLESLTAFLKENNSGFFDLSLPYKTREGEHLPFAPGHRFELVSEAMGLGLRLEGEFVQNQGRDIIRLAITGGLQAFQNRFTPRLDITVGLRYTRGLGTLRTFREQWEKNIEILGRSAGTSALSNFPRSRINLSSGGIRFNLKAPVEPGSLCLILLEIEKSTPPICTLAEVLWTGDPVEERQSAGMRFINVLETDQKRIEEIIRKGDAVVKEPEKS
ncbi:MAG: PilZ domain-containing protein [Desulfuromonadales bacterium]